MINDQLAHRHVEKYGRDGTNKGMACVLLNPLPEESKCNKERTSKDKIDR